MRISFRVEDDYIVKDMEIEQNSAYVTCKTEVVMTKDVFIECYNKWINDPNSTS